jgi:hypothetical protein
VYHSTDAYACFLELGELRASCCCFHRGRHVEEIWIGCSSGSAVLFHAVEPRIMNQQRLKPFTQVKVSNRDTPLRSVSPLSDGRILFAVDGALFVVDEEWHVLQIQSSLRPYYVCSALDLDSSQQQEIVCAFKRVDGGVNLKSVVMAFNALADDGGFVHATDTMPDFAFPPCAVDMYRDFWAIGFGREVLLWRGSEQLRLSHGEAVLGIALSRQHLAQVSGNSLRIYRIS